MSSTTAAASLAVETSLFRALAVLRAVVLAYAVGVNATRWREFEVPWLGWTVVAAIALWTLVISVVYEDARRRTTPWLLADLAVAVAALLSTPLVLSQEQLDASEPTVPTFWVSAALIAWAVHWRWAGGMVAAVAISASDLSIRDTVDAAAVGNIFLMFLAAGVIGYCIGLLRDAAVARSQAERLAAAAAERERLARDIHDGVLQVLALVQRRGTELGGPAADLGRLAGEQEVSLRHLVQQSVSAPVGSDTVDDADRADLGTQLDALGSGRVTVSTTGEPLWVPAYTARQVVAAVRAALDNTATHAGPDAHAWVLVEEETDEIVVSVRDDGPGIPDGRLDAATAEGRMGVAMSICGRLRDLGGDARLSTGPDTGVEWEMHIPHRVGS
ncbi:MAG: MacS family sensor histidine kinase [Nocardioidaceae bacterium]